jgi:hypothetical protein
MAKRKRSRKRKSKTGLRERRAREARKNRSKRRTILLIVLIVVITALALTVTLDNPLNKILKFSENPGKEIKCGDGICDSGEQATCSADCSCVDNTYNESIGEWSVCENNEQRRILQNSCGNTLIDTQACVLQPTSLPEKEFTVTVTRFLDQVEALNKEIKASISAYNDGVITATIFKEKLDLASSESVILYYDAKNIASPPQYGAAYNDLNKAVASQLSGINELIKYFEDTDINHIYSGETWITQSEGYVNNARAALP